MFRWAHSVVLLEALLDNARGIEFIKYVEHLDADGAVVLVLPARSGGTVPKRAGARYRFGKRLGDPELTC